MKVPLSVNDINQPLKLTYNNPIDDILNLNSNLKIGNINVYNQLGQKIFQFKGVSSLSQEVNLASLPTGIYVLELYFENFKHILKIVKS